MASLLIMMTAPFFSVRSEAQDWVATVAAGRLVHESLGSRVGTMSTTVSLGYEGPVALYAAGGAPFDTAGIFWGAVGGSGRFVRPAGSLSAGLDAAADLLAFSPASWDGNGWGTSVEVMPLARLERGVGTLELRTGIERYQQSYAGESDDRTLHMSDARLTIARSGMRADAELRYARADDESYPFAGVSAEYASARGAVWASLGRWFDTEASRNAWGVGAQLAVAPVGALFASYSQEGWDPLYRNEPRRSWNLGVSRRLGQPVGNVDLVDAPEVRNGNVVFSVTDAAAPGPVSIAGDFTGWEVVPMEPAGAGWALTLTVPSGVHRYAFRDGNGTWFVPPTVPDRVDDGFGGVSAVLVVP